MGVWNSHTSVGNILGSVIPGVFVDSAWGLSFIIPGIIIFVMGIIVWLFLVPSPEDVDCQEPDQVGDKKPKQQEPKTWEGLVNGADNRTGKVSGVNPVRVRKKKKGQFTAIKISMNL
jgi:sugar phosphate permease